jgi:CRISPR type III-A-associated RAMP protein Csm4
MLAYRLSFKSALHVDSRGSGEPDSVEEFIRSDTLSAALCLSWHKIFPNDGEGVFKSPPFAVSSAFPYIDDLLLLPVPRRPFWQEVEPTERKRLKRVAWLCPSLAEQVLRGDCIALDGFESMARGKVAVSPNVRSQGLRLGGGDPWMVGERQRVAVDRLGLTPEAGLFFFGLQFFAPGCGLYFLADVDPQTQLAFEAALAYLGDTGIGADRNSGLGHFEFARVENLPWKLPPVADNQGWYLLSLFNPGPNDNLAELTRVSAYGLTSRSGWISGTTIGRPPVRVFTEGSCFSARPLGRVLPLFDDATRLQLGLPHSAPRDFRALAFPCMPPPKPKGEAS